MSGLLRGDNVAGRIFRGLGANVYLQAVVVVVQLASVPILLHYWGAQLYGEWLILFAIPAYLSMTDLGFSQSAGNDMIARIACGDKAGALVVFHSLCALLVAAAAAGLVASAALVAALPISRWMHLRTIGVTSIRWVLWLLASEILVKLMEGAVHAGFRSNGQYAFHHTAYATTLLAQQSSVWVAAALGQGPVAAALSFAAVRWAVTPTLAVVMVRRHPWLRPGFRHARLGELRRLAKPAAANLAVPLSQAINLQGMVLAVGATLGPLPVVVFTTLRTLSRYPVRVAWGVSGAVEPELAAAWGMRKMALLRRLYIRSVSSSFWAGLMLALALLLTGRWVLALWTHGRVEMDGMLFSWLLLTAVVGVLWNGSLNLLKAANCHLRASAWYAISAAAGVGLASILLSTAGNLALVGLALLLTDVLMLIYLSPAAARLAELRVAQLVWEIVCPAPLLKGLVRGFRDVR